MKRLLTFIFIVMVISSFSSYAQSGDIFPYDVADVSIDSLLKHSDARSIVYVPASEKLDGDELANILVPSYLNAGGVYVFKQVAKNSLQFKMVWHSKFKRNPQPNRNGQTPRTVAYGDLDGNGKKEIYFIMGYENTHIVTSDTTWPRGLHVYENIGTNDYGDEPYIIPFETFDPTAANLSYGRNERSGLLAADIDNDGKDELIIGSFTFMNNPSNMDWNSGRAWVVSLESGTFAERNATLKLEYHYTDMAMALPDDGDGYVPVGFSLADVDGDGIKEVVVAGQRNSGQGAAIGFFKATAPNTYISGNVVPISNGPGSTFEIGAQLGVLERQGGDLVFVNMDEHNVINRRVLMLSDVIDISVADLNNFYELKHITIQLGSNGQPIECYAGAAASKSGTKEFEIYFPKETTGIYSLKYNGTGSIYDSTSYTLYEIFNSKQVYQKGLGGLYQLIAPPDDINGNGKKKLIANFQLYRDTESTSDNPFINDVLLNGNIPVTTRNPFWILEYTGTIDVKIVPPIMPEDYVLEQNYPNPFNPSTTIRFTLPTPEDISIIVYDINGKEVCKLIDNQRYETGTFETIWNGKNKDGKNVSSGTYFYKLKWGNFEKSMKMSLVK